MTYEAKTLTVALEAAGAAGSTSRTDSGSAALPSNTPTLAAGGALGRGAGTSIGMICAYDENTHIKSQNMMKPSECTGRQREAAHKR